MLTNVTLYWLTGTANSSARIYREGAESFGQDEQQSVVPTGVAVLPGNISVPIRCLAEKTNKVVHWSELDRGGHFPAMEVPDLLVGDMREFFRRVSQYARTSGVCSGLLDARSCGGGVAVVR